MIIPVREFPSLSMTSFNDAVLVSNKFFYNVAFIPLLFRLISSITHIVWIARIISRAFIGMEKEYREE